MADEILWRLLMVTHIVDDIGIAGRLGWCNMLRSLGHIYQTQLCKGILVLPKILTLALVIIVLFATLIMHG